MRGAAAVWLLLAAALASAPLGCAAGSSQRIVSTRTAISTDDSDAPPNVPLPAADADATETITSVPVVRKPWRFADYEGQIIITPHYRLYTTLKRHFVVDRLPLFLERGLARYTTALAPLPMPSAPLETYLFETRNQWEAKTRQMLPDQAARFLTLGRGGFTTRGVSVLYYIGRTDTLAIAAHEGWHQYSQRTFKEQLPIWLEEGIATYMEGYLSHPGGSPQFRPWANLERYHTLRDAVRKDRLIPLDELLERSPQLFLKTGKNRLLIYYAQVWALTHFLAEGERGQHRAALRQLLLDAAQGRLAARISTSAPLRPGRTASNSRVGPGVLLEYFNSDLAAFEKQYLRFVRQIVKTGGRDPIVQGRSPLAG